MVTIKDVAELAGVSNATVSRVLSNKPHVRVEVREKVMSAVKTLGYRPNRVASSLRRQSSKMVGLLVSDIRNPFFTAIARAIEDVANDHEMSVFLCNTDENSDKERVYLNTLIDEHAAGIILSPTSESRTQFDFLLGSNIPIVSIDRRIDDAFIDTVLSDNFNLAHQLTTHLIENGYDRPAAIIGLKRITTGRQRMAGFDEALSVTGIEIPASWRRFVAPRETASYEAALSLLTAQDRPNAILTGNSRLTIGALRAIKELGLRIPEDVALAGFDETHWMPYVGPGITVVSQPTYELGRTAAELLFARMADPTRPHRETVLRGELILRGSTVRHNLT